MSISDHERHSCNEIIFEDHLEIGYNYRLTDIQAAVGIEQLKKIGSIIEERRKISFKYLNSFNDIECIRLPLEKNGYESNYQSFSIYLKENAPIQRNDVMRKLLEKGISSRRGIMTAHQETAYNFMDIQLPISEDLRDNSILIPLYNEMTIAEINYTIRETRKLLLYPKK